MWDRVNARRRWALEQPRLGELAMGHVVGGMTTPPRLASDMISRRDIQAYSLFFVLIVILYTVLSSCFLFFILGVRCWVTDP